MSHPPVSIIKMLPEDSGNNLLENPGEKVTQRVVLLPKQSTGGNQLVWRGGCLQSILSDVSSQSIHPISGKPGSVAENSQNTAFTKGSFGSKPFSSSTPSIWNPNQRYAANDATYPDTKNSLKRPRGVLNSNNAESNSESSDEKSSPKVRATKSRVRTQTKRSGRKNAAKPVQPLLLIPRSFHPPGNLLLPPLDLISKFDGFASFETDKLITNNNSSGLPTINEENNEEATTTTTANSASVATAGRMKSSAGINDIDFEELKHYRRLNGYSLFVHVNKKKYGSSPGVALVDDVNDANDNNPSNVGTGKENQKSSNHRWQALWLTMPEKVKREWKNKAKRLLKQIEQHGKRETVSEDRKLKERDRLEVQLSRTQTTSYCLLDIAAHFQLLSDRFAVFAKNVTDYEAADPNTAKYDVIKSRYDTLVNEKAKIEKRLAELSEILHQNGDVELDTPLVDDEGFPRSDIDVALIRITRNNIRCLNTDHKQIMLELETALHELHEYARQNPSGKCSHPSKQDSNEDRQIEEKSSEVIKTPFLRIDQIAPNSIAEQADLKIGDLVVQFGSVTAKNFSSLQDISTVFKNTPPGSCIQMSIIRGNNVNTVLSVSLLKPTGNASLGLHVVPV